MLIHVSTIESGPPAIRAGRHEGVTLRAGYDAFFDAAAGLAGSAPPSNDGRGLHRGSRKVMVPAGGGLAAATGGNIPQTKRTPKAVSVFIHSLSLRPALPTTAGRVRSAPSILCRTLDPCRRGAICIDLRDLRSPLRQRPPSPGRARDCQALG